MELGYIFSAGRGAQIREHAVRIADMHHVVAIALEVTMGPSRRASLSTASRAWGLVM
jgi:hypothetical protein